MATLLDLKTAILDIAKNHYILDTANVTLASRINDAVTEIAGGVLLPDGMISPPLPDLYETAAVNTSTTLPYVALPETYQRSLVWVANNAGVKISPPDRSDYYGFAMFVEAASSKLLNTQGTITRACVKGLRLYYQAVPSASAILNFAFHRKPVEMVHDADTVDGIPSQFQIRLIRHYVGRQLANEMVDGTEKLANYHSGEFARALLDMVEFIGIDGAPTAMRKKPTVEIKER